MPSRYGEAGERAAAEWMNGMNIVTQPVTLEHAKIAAAAYARYRGRPARLNPGDCFAYALAQANAAPLLYQGANFPHTDVRPA